MHGNANRIFNSMNRDASAFKTAMQTVMDDAEINVGLREIPVLVVKGQVYHSQACSINSPSSFPNHISTMTLGELWDLFNKGEVCGVCLTGYYTSPSDSEFPRTLNMLLDSLANAAKIPVATNETRPADLEEIRVYAQQVGAWRRYLNVIKRSAVLQKIYARYDATEAVVIASEKKLDSYYKDPLFRAEALRLSVDMIIRNNVKTEVALEDLFYENGGQALREAYIEGLAKCWSSMPGYVLSSMTNKGLLSLGPEAKALAHFLSSAWCYGGVVSCIPAAGHEALTRLAQHHLVHGHVVQEEPSEAVMDIIVSLYPTWDKDFAELCEVALNV